MDFKCEDGEIFYFTELVKLTNEKKIHIFNNIKTKLSKIDIDYNKLCLYYIEHGEKIVALKACLDELNIIKASDDENLIHIEEMINKINDLCLYYENKFKKQIIDDIYVFKDLINQNKNQCDFIIEVSMVETKYDYYYNTYKLNDNGEFEYKNEWHTGIFNFEEISTCIYEYLIKNLLHCRQSVGEDPTCSDYRFFN